VHATNVYAFGVEMQLHPFLAKKLDEVIGQLHTSVALFQKGDFSVPLNKRLDGHQKQSGFFGAEIQNLTTSGIDIRFR
jgi:hypothetical protein